MFRTSSTGAHRTLSAEQIGQGIAAVRQEAATDAAAAPASAVSPDTVPQYYQPAQPQYAAPQGQAINVGGRMIQGYTQAQQAVTDATAAVQRWPTLKLEAGLYSAQHPSVLAPCISLNVLDVSQTQRTTPAWRAS